MPSQPEIYFYWYTLKHVFLVAVSPHWALWGWVTEKLNNVHFPPLLPCSTNSKYVAINYRAASAAESKHPEYSGSMTHQIGAVQGAARENTSHFSTLQPTSSIRGTGVLVLLSSGNYTYSCTAHIGLHHHLVGRGDITHFFFISQPSCAWLCGNGEVMCLYTDRHWTEDFDDGGHKSVSSVMRKSPKWIHSFYKFISWCRRLRMSLVWAINHWIAMEQRTTIITMKLMNSLTNTTG